MSKFLEISYISKKYYMNCEEGHNGIIDVILYMDLSGWLIDKNDEEGFLKYYNNFEESVPYAKNFISVTWPITEDGNIKVYFQKTYNRREGISCSMIAVPLLCIIFSSIM